MMMNGRNTSERSNGTGDYLGQQTPDTEIGGRDSDGGGPLYGHR